MAYRFAFTILLGFFVNELTLYVHADVQEETFPKHPSKTISCAVQTLIAMGRILSPVSKTETGLARNNFYAFRVSPRGVNQFQDKGYSFQTITVNADQASGSDKAVLAKRIQAIEAQVNGEVSAPNAIVQGYRIEGAENIAPFIRNYQEGLSELSERYPPRVASWPIGRDPELVRYFQEIERPDQSPKEGEPEWIYSGRNYSVIKRLFNYWKNLREESGRDPVHNVYMRINMQANAMPPSRTLENFLVSVANSFDPPAQERHKQELNMPVYVDYLYERDVNGKPVLSVFFRAYPEEPRFLRKKSVSERFRGLVPVLPKAPELAPVRVPGERRR